MFAPQVSALSDAYRVVAYNLRARTDRYRESYDLDDLADDCAALMDHLGIERAVLGGMSMGGFMGLRFALRYPERLSGLVLIDSIADPHTPEEQETYEEMIAGLRDAPAVPSRLAETVSHLLFGRTTHEERPDLVAEWVERWQTYPPASVVGEVESWLYREGVADRLGEIDVPVLVVHGEEDAALDVERAEPMLDALPDARLARIPAAGHSSNLERPAAVNEAVRTFLDDVA